MAFRTSSSSTTRSLLSWKKQVRLFFLSTTTIVSIMMINNFINDKNNNNESNNINNSFVHMTSSSSSSSLLLFQKLFVHSFSVNERAGVSGTRSHYYWQIRNNPTRAIAAATIQGQNYNNNNKNTNRNSLFIFRIRPTCTTSRTTCYSQSSQQQQFSESSSSSSTFMNGASVQRGSATRSKQSKSQVTKQMSSGSSSRPKQYKHILAILAMPYTSVDRIANEVILETVLRASDQHNKKLSIVLRCENSVSPTVAELRRYVGEIYSQLWDCTMQLDSAQYETLITSKLPDVVVYPQNLPNAAPESWIDIQPDLDCICSHDFITGWTSEVATTRRIATTSTSTTADLMGQSTPEKQEGLITPKGEQYRSRGGAGFGGLKEHVTAVNFERKVRNLKPVEALHVDAFFYHPAATVDDQQQDMIEQNIIFLDDDDDCTIPDDINDDDEETNDNYQKKKQQSLSPILSGAMTNSRSKNNQLFYSVACGGTFDGMHYGHRKLLTLAVSSVHPITGRLLVGVTIDAMLQNKAYREYIPTFEERCEGVRKFLYRLAPGMINRIHIEPISDSFGPPGKVEQNKKFQFDALVLSHETLPTGIQLNNHRLGNGMEPLQLLCTRRTEAHGMSSTALRKIRSQEQQRRNKNDSMTKQ